MSTGIRHCGAPDPEDPGHGCARADGHQGDHRYLRGTVDTRSPIVRWVAWTEEFRMVGGSKVVGPRQLEGVR